MAFDDILENKKIDKNSSLEELIDSLFDEVDKEDVKDIINSIGLDDIFDFSISSKKIVVKKC